MNRHEDFDEAVARWLDDGPEAAPDRFVWAALEEVDRAPQRTASPMALENMPMLAKLALPIAGVAAVLVAAVLVFGQFNGPGPVGDSPSPEVSPASTPSPVPEACGVEPASGGGVHVVWCAQSGNDGLVVDFTFDAPESWADEWYGGIQTLYLVPDGRRIAIARSGPDTIDAWRDQLVATTEFEVADPTSITLDGIDGYVFDIRVAEGVDSNDAPPVFEDTELDFTLSEGNTARVWLVAFPDEALAIVTSASDEEFDAWVGTVSDAVETIEWAP